MSSTFSIHVHHGGFLTPPPDSRYSGGSVDYFDKVEYDKTGFFDIEDFVKKLLSNNPFSAIWYSKPGFSTFEQSLEILTDDFGAMEMMMIARNNSDIVSIYVEHPLDDDNVESEQGYKEGAVDGVQSSEDSLNDSVMGISFDDSDSDSNSSEEFEGTIDTRGEKKVEDQSTDDTQWDDDWEGSHTDDEELPFTGEVNDEHPDGMISYPEFKEPYDPKNIKFRLGLLFKSRQFLKKVLIDYSVHNLHSLKFEKNDKQRVKMVCTGKGCEWKIYASPYNNTDAFQVKTYHQHHTCSMVHDNKRASDTWLASQWVKTLKKQPSITVNDLLQKARKKWNLDLSRQKVYRAKKKAEIIVEGAVDAQFKLLPRYLLEVRETNIGSSCYVKCVTQNELDVIGPSTALFPRFERLYYSISAWKNGFMTACRPIIGLDGCHLKGVHGGQLLAAVTKDPNDRIFVIAIAVVELECYDSWSWFLKSLLDDIGSIEDKGWTFISDQQKGLEKYFTNYPVQVNHRHCIRHLYNNFRKQFPSMQLKDKLWNAARATYIGAWKKEMDEMKVLDSKAWEIMMKKDPSTWSRSAFSPYSKCDVLLNNMSESFNSTIIEARSKPIITMLEMIRTATMKRFSENRQKMLTFKGPICPVIQKKLNKEKKESTKWCPIWCGTQYYQVSSGPHSIEAQYAVNLAEKTCSCRKWDISGIPCCHSVAAMMLAGVEPEQYVHKYYSREAYMACYEPIVHATRGEDQWPEAELRDLNPPVYKRAGGRPRKLRRLEPDEQRIGKCGAKLSKRNTPAKCQKCGRVGHNARTCKGERIEADDAARKKAPRRDTNKKQIQGAACDLIPRKSGQSQSGAQSRSQSRANVDAGPRLRTRACSTQQSTSRKSRRAGPSHATQ